MIREHYRLMDEAGGEGGEPGGGVPPAAAPAPAFHESLQDEGLRAWAQTKGLKDAESAVKSAYNAEKLLGAPADQIIRLPSEMTPEAMKGVLAKLGAPDSADKYEIPAAEGLPVDEAFQGWAKGTFHKLGLPAATAKALVEEWNGYVKSALDSQTADAQAKFTADESALKTEWGNGFDRKMLVAKNAAQKLGFSEEILNGLEAQLGYAGVMKFMAELGGKLGEDTFVGDTGTGNRGFGQMTPAEAKVEWEKMLMDSEVTKALTSQNHPGHRAAVEKKTRLFSIMHPEQ